MKNAYLKLITPFIALFVFHPAVFAADLPVLPNQDDRAADIGVDAETLEARQAGVLSVIDTKNEAIRPVGDPLINRIPEEPVFGPIFIGPDSKHPDSLKFSNYTPAYFTIERTNGYYAGSGGTFYGTTERYFIDTYSKVIEYTFTNTLTGQSSYLRYEAGDAGFQNALKTMIRIVEEGQRRTQNAAQRQTLRKLERYFKYIRRT